MCPWKQQPNNSNKQAKLWSVMLLLLENMREYLLSMPQIRNYNPPVFAKTVFSFYGRKMAGNELISFYGRPSIITL
jgi:hypothetical protein